MNYVELFNNVQSYTENNFPDFVLSDGSIETTQELIDRFIQQAEQRIYNSVQLANLRKNVTGQLTAGNKYLSAPIDFLSVYSLAVITPDGSYEYLLNKDVNFIRAAYPAPTDEGLPRHYAIFGPRSDDVNELSFLVGPTPDDDYDVELHYYYYPESIVTAGTTWLSENFDTVLLYGTLVEAYTFMKGESDMLALYDGKYKEALGLLKGLGDGKQRGDAYRDGQARVRVG